jgi:hypothetical protein
MLRSRTLKGLWIRCTRGRVVLVDTRKLSDKGWLEDVSDRITVCCYWELLASVTLLRVAQ